MSIAITVSIFGAQAIGAGNAGRLDAIVRTGLLLNLILTGGLMALIYLCSPAIVGFFITDAAVLDLAQGALHIVFWRSVVFGMATVISGVVRASGTVFLPMALPIVSTAHVEVPSS